MNSMLGRWITPAAGAVVLAMSTVAVAKVSQAEADRLGKDLTPMGAEKAGNAEGTIPAWTGGMAGFQPPEDGKRHPESYAKFGVNDKPIYTVTKSNMGQYDKLLTPGHKAMLEKYGDTYKMNVHKTQRTAFAPQFVYDANKRNAVKATLANDGESLQDAVTGIPFPIPQSGKEVIWNHKLRYRGQGVTRYNTQLAVQNNGAFVPYVLREDVLFAYNRPNITLESLENVAIYFLQLTTAPPRQAGQVLLVHETIDQVKEARRAWLYNPGQRRTRRAPNVGYDNPGTGADGLRTNDQLDVFNGATDRYTWKLIGKREMLMPYNAYKLVDNRVSYDELTGEGHLNQDLARYELRRVWVVDSNVKDGTSHIYKRRTFYVDEDSWSIVAADIYDKRDQLWRVQEYHSITIPWFEGIGPAAGTIYDLQSGRYLVMECSNEEPLPEATEFELDHFRTSNIKRVATQLR